MRFSWREDVVAPGEDRRAELRHERDRRLLPHPRQRRIGIGPERWDVDVEMRGVGHGELLHRDIRHCDSLAPPRRCGNPPHTVRYPPSTITIEPLT